MTFSCELRLEIVQLFYSCGRRVRVTRRTMQTKYGHKLRNLTEKTIQRIVGKFEASFSLKNELPPGRPKSKIVEKTKASIKRTLEESPRRSIRSIAKRTKVSRMTVWRIVRNELKKFPYKIQIKQKQTCDNKANRLDFGHRLSAKIETNPAFLRAILFSDEAHFELSGYVNSQNCRYWANEQPHAVVESPKGKEKVTVWMAIGYNGVYGPYFFEDSSGERETVKTQNYLKMMKQKFVPALKRKKLLDKAWFMQDGAPPHCSKDAMEALAAIFSTRLISRNAAFSWPSYSPDLNPCDFFLWGYLKSVVYSNPVPKTVSELKSNIKRDVRKLNQETINSAIDNILPRIQHLISRKGQWFEQILNS